MTTLFLAMPTTNGIYKLIVQHLEAHGFTVCDLSFADNNDIFRRPTLAEKIRIKYRKKSLATKKPNSTSSLPAISNKSSATNKTSSEPSSKTAPNTPCLSAATSTTKPCCNLSAAKRTAK